MWLVEPTTFIGAGERHIAEQLQQVGVPVILIINKIDTVKKEEILPPLTLTAKSVILQRSFPALRFADRIQRTLLTVFSSIFPMAPCFMMRILLQTSPRDRS